MTPLGNKSRKTQFSCKVLAGGICIRIGGKPGVYRNPVPYILYRNTLKHSLAEQRQGQKKH
jgi:hypothetical protein